MRSTQLLCTILMMALPAAAFSRDGPAERRAAAIQAHTGFLAHDLLEGRDTGSRGYDLAAAYVAAQFAAAGLRPGGTQGWYQPFTVRRRNLESIAIGWMDGTASIPAINGKDVALDPSPWTQDETLNLEMVFVGWGIDAPSLGLDDYAGLDVRGKAVVLLEGAPKNLPGAVRAHFGWIQQKERMAAARGAVAVFTLKPPARERVSPWERTRRLRPLEGVSRVPAAVGPGQVIQATMTLGPGFAQQLFQRSGRDLADIYRRSEHTSPAGFPMRGRMTIARRSRHLDGTSANVLGIIPGTDSLLKDEHVVIVSHLDHVGIGPQIKGDRIYNGAVDNAGGVAVMLEVARSIKAGRPPRRSILFIATAGEERGLLGSELFVEQPTVPLGKIVAAISVDGLMAFHDFGGVVALGAEQSTLGQLSARAARSIGAVHVPDPIPERGNLALSDQYPFLRQGIPVLFPNPARGLPRSGSGGEAQWDAYETQHYHQPSDDMALPLRWDVAARWADYIERLVVGTADAQARPFWYADDTLGRLFAPSAPKVAPGR